jgi:hypothetical protein
LANPRSNKRDIARAREEKAALKRSRRQHSETEAVDPAATSPPSPPVPATSERNVLDALDALHRRFAAGDLSFDEFDARKMELLDRLAQ